MKGQRARIILAGGSGLIGTACREYFTKVGYEVIVLTRKQETSPWEMTWDPAREEIEENVTDGASAVINLCGLPLPAQRWTDKYKSRLHDSRILPARFLAELIRRASVPPRTYIGASAIGIYGDRPFEPAYETDPIVEDRFVPKLVAQWESAHRSVEVMQHYILRIGVVLSPESGFLEKVIPPTRFGIYPCFGSGKQVISWIWLNDLVRIMAFMISNSPEAGVYNAAASGSVGQKDLMRALRSVSGRPGLILPVPRIVLNIMLGQVASLLFESTDVRPDKVIGQGFHFEAEDIRAALRRVL